MSQLAVILDNSVKIFENFNGSGRKQAPAGEQQQISQEQHRNALLKCQTQFTAEVAKSAEEKIKGRTLCLVPVVSLLAPTDLLPELWLIRAFSRQFAASFLL